MVLLNDMTMVFIWSVLLAFVIVALTRFLVDQNKSRQLKKDMNFYRQKMREAQKAGNLEEANKHMKDFSGLSRQQLSMSMKPLMASMVLFLVVLGLLNTVYSGPAVELENGAGAFSYKGSEFPVILSENDGVFSVGLDFNNDGTLSDNEIYKSGDLFRHEGSYYRIFVESGDEKGRIFFQLHILKMPVNLPFFGSHLSWLWWYILISVPANLFFRKMLGVE